MDFGEDLYGDLPHFTTSDYIAKLETKVEVLEERIKQLETALANCERDKRNILINNDRDKKNLISTNDYLQTNVSTLFKTAKKEISRKDTIIKELRQQLDDIIFRRFRKSWPKNDIQFQNEDDAICAKPTSEGKSSVPPVSEDKSIIPSIIRSSSKNSDRCDREKSSSEDKSPFSNKLNSRKFEHPERDKHADLGRARYTESQTLERRSKDFNNAKYHISHAVSGHREEYYANKNISDPYLCRRIERKNKEEDRDVDDHERRTRIDLKPKDRQRYSPYEHRKEEHERSKHKYYWQDREYKKSVSRKFIEDRRREEPAYSSRTVIDDRRPIPESVIRKVNEDSRSEELVPPSRNANFRNDRRSDADFLRKEVSVHSGSTTFDDRRQKPEFFGRKFGEQRIRDDSIQPYRNAIENRLRNDNNTSQKLTDEDRRLHHRSMIKNQKIEDLSSLNKNITHVVEDDDLDKFIKNLNDKYKKLVDCDQNEDDCERRYDFTNSDRLSTQENHLKSKPSSPSSQVHRKREKRLKDSIVSENSFNSLESSANGVNQSVMFQSTLQPQSHVKEEDTAKNFTNREINADTVNVARKEKTRRPKHSASKTSHRKKSKSSKYSSSSKKRLEPSIEETTQNAEQLLSSQPELQAKKAKLSQHSSPATAIKPVEVDANESSHDTKSLSELPSQSVRTSLSPSSSPLPPPSKERSHQIDSHMMVLEILAQYGGYYATPLKLLNGDKHPLANFKLVSPIADTPDHLRAVLNESKIKISPIPMLNERRVLDDFSSPVKTTVASSVETANSKCVTTISEITLNSGEEAEKTSIRSDDVHATDCRVTEPVHQLNIVTTSPFKNCCIVKVKTDIVANEDSKSTSNESVTANCGTDTTNAEHKVFTRKRRAPVIRNLKKPTS